MSVTNIIVVFDGCEHLSKSIDLKTENLGQVSRSGERPTEKTIKIGGASCSCKLRILFEGLMFNRRSEKKEKKKKKEKKEKKKKIEKKETPTDKTIKIGGATCPCKLRLLFGQNFDFVEQFLQRCDVLFGDQKVCNFGLQIRKRSRGVE